MTELKDEAERFFSELEQLAQKHDELYDTDVREALADTLNYYFVWGKTADSFPRSYQMFSAKGDAAVGEAVSTFLESAIPLAESLGLDVGQARLDALQDESIVTPEGESYDSFIGHADEPSPAELADARFEPGEYDEEIEADDEDDDDGYDMDMDEDDDEDDQ